MGEKRIRKPMYAKEDMGRLVRWFFGYPLIFIIYLVLSLLLPRSTTGMRMTIGLNIISYSVFLMSAALVISRFLKFPLRKMVNQNQTFCFRNLISGFASSFILIAGTTFILMAVRPQDFTYSLGRLWPVDFLLSFVLVVLAALLEEILCRSYIAFFVNDSMPEEPGKKTICCLASAVVFTILHFQNPEISGKQAIYAMMFYFVMGFALMAVTLRTKGIEAALGIHIANNLVSAWLFTYDNAALTTNAVFTQHNSIGPLMVIQSVICITISIITVIRFSPKETNLQNG